jgi:hypothetical protein
MKEKLFGILFKAFLVVGALLLGGALWYYTLGRKPKLVVSTKIAAKAGSPSSHLIAPGEVLLLVGTKATLYDLAAGKSKWSMDAGPIRTAPAPTPTAAPVVRTTPPASSPSEKGVLPLDQLPPQILQARVERRRAKLEKWAAELSARRANPNTALKVASLKEEEAKYQAELVEARAEMAALQKSSGVTPVALRDTAPAAVEPTEDSFETQQKEVFSDGKAIWVIQGRAVRMLDRANGRVTKEIPIAGNFKKALPGAGCLYVVSGEGAVQRVTRIAAADGAVQAIDVTGASAEDRFEWNQGGQPPTPIVQPQRTEFSASGAELLQVDLRLIEKKITERQALKRDSVSDWEAADKNTTGGWSSDAAVIAQTMANDAQREMTGGKDLIDESSYEVVLRRPFKTGSTDAAPVTVKGRPDVFSTPSLDLVVAGQTLIAFDHANKKLWEAKLAYPAAPPSYRDDPSIGPAAATAFHPCLEDDKRLYFFDKGFLNAFDRATGKTLWRLPSVGIRKVQLDAGGMLDKGAVLYVTSDNGSAETLQYSQQAALPSLPLVFKIDAGTGKILWKLEKYEDCFVSGGSVYVTRETRNAEDMANAVFDKRKAIETRFKLYKLSARDGQAQWEWFQTRRPLHIEADKKKVSLLFADELQVLTSRAL